MSVLDLGPVVLSFKTGTYAVTRRGPATYVNGRKTDAAPTVVNVDGCVQPVTGRDLQRLPEGRRGGETIKILTVVELFTEDASHAADTLSIDGYTWEVASAERWGTMASYYRSLLTKVTP